MSKTFSKVVVTLGLAASLLVPAVAHGQTSTTTTTTTTTAISYAFTRDLTVGSVGADVSALQTILIERGFLHITAPTGYFGPLTKSAVAAWQASVGLPSTGYFGPLSRAKVAAMAATTVTVTSSFPAGCTSNTGFSTTTGASCAVVVTLPAGCTSTAGYSPLTGVKCDTMSPLPAGCTSTVGYSPTTGVRCDTVATTTTTTTTTSTTSTTTTSGAGSIDDANFISSISNEDVGEDESDVKVLGLDLDVDSGSDIQLLAVRVEFEEQAAGGSQNLDDYASEVSIWLGDEQIGSADVDAFDEDSDVWSKTISLSGENTIDAGDVGQLYVAISSLSNIDSNDIGSANNDWRVGVSSIRFKDTQGAVITDDSTGDIGVDLEANTGAYREFQFETFASAADIELKLTEDSSNPDAQVVEADDTNSTDNVLLLAGTLKALGSDIHINEMTVTLTPSGNTDGDEIASQVILVIDGVEVQSLNTSACTVAANCDGDTSDDFGTALVYVFDDVEYDLDENDVVDVEVRVDVNDIDGTEFVAGATLTASMDNDNTDAEDQNGDDLAASDKSGTVAGNQQAFYADGIRVTVGTRTTDVVANDTADGDDTVTFTWGITVSAFGDSDVYVNADAADVVCSSAAAACAADGSAAADVDTLYNIEKSGGADVTANSGVISDTTDATEVAADASAFGGGYSGENFFRVVSGTSESFTITVTAENATESKLIRALLTGIEWTVDDITCATACDGSTAVINNYTFDLNNASPTPWKTIN